MDVFRTPDERFADLPGYPYAPHYVDVGPLRLHHLDEGSGPTVLYFHGEPSWSYLYRHMLDGLVATGHRVVCPDLVGFGRSDKPTDPDWYTYERHVETVTAHLDQLELQDVTVVLRDGVRVPLVAATYELTQGELSFYRPGEIGPVAIFDRSAIAGFICAAMPDITSPSDTRTP